MIKEDLDIAIRNFEQSAEKYEMDAKYYTTSRPDKERAEVSKTNAEEYQQLAKWLKELKEFRELNLCNDTISKTDAKKYLSAPDENGDRVIYEDDLDLLSPVFPARPKGKWIDEDGNEVPFFKGTTQPSKSCWCSNCKEWLIASDEYAVNGAFCPNCGIDMRGKENG